MSQEQTLLSEVGGTVSRIECAEGSVLDAGDTIVVIESMKMEIPMTAPHRIKVIRLLISAGELVEENQPVAVVVES